MVGKVSLLLAAGAVLLGGAVLVQDPPKPPADAMPAVKIGFVDMFRVQEQSARQKEAFGKLQEQTMQDKQGLEKRVTDLQKKQREELPLFEEGSPEFEKLRVEILTEEQHIKFLQRRSDRTAQAGKRPASGCVLQGTATGRGSLCPPARVHGHSAGSPPSRRSGARSRS